MQHNLSFPFPVSRGTLDAFSIYLDLLHRWNSRINLIGKSTEPDSLTRHIMDCAQIYTLLPPKIGRLVDMGSGAGLPGIVLALLGVCDVHLIESDKRKSAFLQEVSRETGVAFHVHACRIENASVFSADVVTARALAPLPQLLGYASHFLHTNSFCLFPKGANYIKELDEVTGWTYDLQRIPSITHAESVILQFSHLRRTP